MKIPEELELLAEEARKYDTAEDFVEKGLSRIGKSYLYYPTTKDLYNLQIIEESNAEVFRNALKKPNLKPEQKEYYQKELAKSEDVVNTIKKLREAGFNTYLDFYTYIIKEFYNK
jgi:hypothetical protein